MFSNSVKVIVVGNGGVGKTTCIKRYGTGGFTEDYKSTVGVDFVIKEEYVAKYNEKVTLMLWDTAGQEMYDSLTKKYYRGAAAAIIVYSIVDFESFQAIKSWKKKVSEECGEDIIYVLLQNKMDLIENSVISKNAISDLKSKLGVKHFQSSAYDNINITEVFMYVCEEYLRRQNKTQAYSRQPSEKLFYPISTTTTRAAFRKWSGMEEIQLEEEGWMKRKSNIQPPVSKDRSTPSRRYCTIL